MLMSMKLTCMTVEPDITRVWTLVTASPSQMSSQKRRRAQVVGGSSWSQVQWQGLSLAQAPPPWTE